MQQLASSSGGYGGAISCFKAAICAQNAPKYQVYICFLCLRAGFKCQMADEAESENGEASRVEKRECKIKTETIVLKYIFVEN